ncbi:cystatin-F [Aulostomus maculatus]
MSLRTLLFILLLALLEFQLVGSHHGHHMPGSPYNVSLNDHGLQRVILTATNTFNNQSNDAFLFKPAAIHRAERQIVKGIRYIIDLEISRTVCHKRDDNNTLSQCDFQPAGHLHQTLQCHTEAWLLPWQHNMKTLFVVCKP